MTSFRQSSWFRRFRRTPLFVKVIRPAYSHEQLRAWWGKGRPAPPPHDIKLAAMLYLADRIGAEAFVETGAFLGDTVRALQGRFKLLASIELAESLATPLKQEFAGDPSIRIITGDSGIELAKLIPEIDAPVVYWLDAHYSGGATVGDGHVPIFSEIDSIAKLTRKRHAILVDDMKDFTGSDGYPTEQQLAEKLAGLGYEVSSFNNMLHAVSAP